MVSIKTGKCRDIYTLTEIFRLVFISDGIFQEKFK